MSPQTLLRAATILLAASMIAGCALKRGPAAPVAQARPVAFQPLASAPTSPPPQQVQQATAAAAAPAVKTFVATGYGSQNAFGKYSVGQRKLMAMRAAKVDAYRNLAELVYGFSVDGRTTVADFVAQNDQARSWVSAFIRGARVTEIVQESDGNYRATVELPSSVRLVECLVHSQCAAPVSVVPNCTGTHCGVYTAPVVTRPCVTGCVAPAFHYAN